MDDLPSSGPGRRYDCSSDHPLYADLPRISRKSALQLVPRSRLAESDEPSPQVVTGLEADPSVFLSVEWYLHIRKLQHQEILWTAAAEP